MIKQLQNSLTVHYFTNFTNSVCFLIFSVSVSSNINVPLIRNFDKNLILVFTLVKCYLISGVSGSKPGEVRLKGFWAHTLACIEKISV